MVNYANGKIYRIICNVSGKQYIGSTTRPLSERLNGHKKDYTYFLKGKKNWITSFEIIKNNNYSIILIENVICENKEQLLKKEREYIESMSCVNKYIPQRNNTEYRIDNKEKIFEQRKQYRGINKDKITEQNRQYYQANKQDISEKAKQPYQCLCGSVICFGIKARHFKSKKHLCIS